jgi:hypothetical protein
MDKNRPDQLETSCSQLLDQMSRVLDAAGANDRFWKLDKRFCHEVSDILHTAYIA